MAKGKKNKGKRGKKKGLPVRLYLFLLLISAAVFLPTTILFVVCMLPTLVAAMVDRFPQRNLTLTVGAMNLAGTVPPWLELLESGHETFMAARIISDPMVWIMAYGAAAAGWIIYYNVTPFVATIMVGRAKGRIKDLEKKKKKLEKQWGEGVSGAVPEKD